MPVVNEETRDYIMALVKKFKNIILTGGHGVGKTTMIMSILKELGIGPVKYYSCSTLDPWVDLVGIPVPNGASLKFCRPKDLMDAQVVVCDEINRSHPKVQNSLLEAIQFKTINGQPLPKLKMVIAMQNPATKMYQVTDLDPALVDRFHARITLTGCPSVEFYKSKGIDEKVAVSLCDWWQKDLNDETRQLVTPRTLESIGGLIKDGLNWKFSIGDSLGVALFGLEQRLQTNCGISKYEGLTLRQVLIDLESHADLARQDKDFATHISKEIEHSRAVTCWDAAEVIVALPEEFQMRLMMNKKWVSKMSMEYPKLHESFHSCDEVKTLHNKLERVGGKTPSSVLLDDNDNL
jgi:hypothetical protein